MKRAFIILATFWFACIGAALADQSQYVDVHMRSSLLSGFWGRDISIEAHILLPDSYYKEPQKRYPVLYWIQGFDGTGQLDLRNELVWQTPMRALHQEYILILLNGMFNGGHQEFADSANNGPWGSAPTQVFIPATDAHFRTVGTPETRFVGGHSSGGWSALWLQITYPDLFGGEWSISPDPVDFRDFTGPDLTQTPLHNFFQDDSGHQYVIDGTPLKGFVNGPGWEHRQFESFDSVFSPRGSDGKPLPLFDRRTGIINAAVAKYWEEHYDIARILRDNWSILGPKLRRKIHVIVGTKDQFGLEPPVVMLQKELQGLGSDAEFDYAEDCNHFTVFNWSGGAIRYIIREADSMLPAANATDGGLGRPRE
jgi:pimeloyl-ACP methyl ester carboxylesterase